MSELTPFDQILAAARAQNDEALSAALQRVSIDVSMVGRVHYSAATQLAFENNLKPLAFLLNHRSEISYAAMGAAMGGHRSYAEQLINQGAKINWVASGAARGGHRVYAEELILRGASIDWVASGAAEAGDRDYADELIRRGANFAAVATGAAQGGHRNYADELIARGANFFVVATGAAQGGHRDYAEELILQGTSIGFVAYGAARGGHRDYAEELIARGADICEVAYGAVHGGYRGYADELIARGASINLFGYLAALGGHRDYVDELIRRGLSISSIVCGAVTGGCVSNQTSSQLHFLSCYREKLIPRLILELKKEKIRVSKETEKLAVAISNLRFQGFSYREALIKTSPDKRKTWVVSELLQRKFRQELSLHILSFLAPVSSSKQMLDDFRILERSLFSYRLRQYLAEEKSIFKIFSKPKNKYYLSHVSALLEIIDSSKEFSLPDFLKSEAALIKDPFVKDDYTALINFWSTRRSSLSSQSRAAFFHESSSSSCAGAPAVYSSAGGGEGVASRLYTIEKFFEDYKRKFQHEGLTLNPSLDDFAKVFRAAEESENIRAVLADVGITCFDTRLDSGVTSIEIDAFTFRPRR